MLTLQHSVSKAETETGRKYYVTMNRNGRYAFLLGPFTSHDAALSRVDVARHEAYEVDPDTIWDAFGTASLAAGLISYPQGSLNKRLGL